MLLHRLTDLVLAYNLPEPDYFAPLPNGDEALLAYHEERVALVDHPLTIEGWQIITCTPDSLDAGVAALALALGYGRANEPEAPVAPQAAAQEAPDLTRQQRKAVEHPGGPARILAGAGTGKTTVIVQRFHHLVRQGVRPERILCLTFSREAARAMRDAILPGLGAAARLWVLTFHAFCLKVLESEGVAGLRLAPEVERRAMLAAVTADQPFQHYTGTRRRALAEEALALIGQAKDYLLTPDDLSRYAQATGNARLADMAQAYRLYQAELERQGAADFADFIGRTVAMLEQNAEMAARWQGRFDHILVDEFQDTNLAQFRVLQVLAQTHGNLVVVGDDDQAIYRFRGASDRYLVNWEAPTYLVEENFRCPAPVIDAANALIERNAPDRVAKRLVTTTKLDGFPPVRHLEAQTEREEAEAVAAEIAARIHRGEGRPGDFAILCRSLRRTGGEFARALTRRSIPCRMLGEEGAHPLVAQTLALLRLTRGLNTPDLLAVLSGRMAPAELYATLRAGKGDLTAAQGEAMDGLQAWLAAHAGRPLPDLVYQALRWLGHLRLSLQPTPAEVERLLAVRELQERAAEAPDLDALLAATSQSRPTFAPGDAVTLMTVHAAKGLEFPVVYVTGLAEGLFPIAVDTATSFYSAEAIRDWIDQGEARQPGDEHIREERRLAYVALTRALRELVLTRARQYDQEPVEPSRFLAELGAPKAEQARVADPLPDARSYLLKVAAGLDPGEPERVAHAVGLLSRHPQAVPLRRQEPPAPFAGGESLRLSATALEAYRECPRRYYYAQVLRLPDEDNLALAFGDAAHGALEQYHRAWLSTGAQPPWDELHAAWQRSLDRSRCETEGQYRQLLERGRIFLDRYHRWAGSRWRRILSVEDRFEVPYTDAVGRTHRLVGRYDLIAETADGTVEIVDFKTGHRKGATTVNKRPTKGSENNPDRKQQLGLYYLARFGGEIDPKAKVTYIFLRHVDDKYPAALVDDFDPSEQALGCGHTADSLALIRTATDEIVANVLANRFDRTPDENKCRYCPFSEVCEVSPDDWF